MIGDLSELPPASCAREFDGKRWTTLREASLRPDPKPCDRTFLAALLRRADVQERESVYEAAQRMIEADRAAYEKRVADAVEQRTRRAGEAIKQVEAFEAAAGLKIEDFYGDKSAGEIGALVKAIRETGIVSSWNHLANITRTLKAKAAEIDEVLRASGLPFPEAAEVKPKRKRASP